MRVSEIKIVAQSSGKMGYVDAFVYLAVSHYVLGHTGDVENPT